MAAGRKLLWVICAQSGGAVCLQVTVTWTAARRSCHCGCRRGAVSSAPRSQELNHCQVFSFTHKLSEIQAAAAVLVFFMPAGAPCWWPWAAARSDTGWLGGDTGPAALMCQQHSLWTGAVTANSLQNWKMSVYWGDVGMSISTKI